MLETTTSPVEPEATATASTIPSETPPGTPPPPNQQDLKKLLVGFLLDRKILIDEASLFILDDLTQDSPLSFSFSLLSQLYESEAKQTHPTGMTGSSFLRLLKTHLEQKQSTTTQSAAQQLQQPTPSQQPTLQQPSQQTPPLQSHSPPFPTPHTKPLGTVELLFHYTKASKKREVKSFVSYFNKRYQSIKQILQNRQELENVTSISRLQTQPPHPHTFSRNFSGNFSGKQWNKDRPWKQDRSEANADAADRPVQERVAVIGMIKEKRETANKNIILVVEDPTGFINVLVTKTRSDLFALIKQCVLDEVIGVVGTLGDHIIFANNILLPDVPLNKELKKAPDEVYALFLSDIHVGSKQFLPEEFERFLLWLNGGLGSPQHREIAKKVQYLFITGDVVDGVGVYPLQQQELIIKDIYQQYEELARYLKRVPPHIQIILSPGNHDAVRLEEPQPPLHKEYAQSLYGWPNLHLVSNPAVVNIHKSKNFPGFDVLMYHGYSFDHYIATVDHIRENGGYDRADLVMKFLLQRRHLSPSHSAAIYIPDDEEDPLVLSKVPDIFACGHLHKAAIAQYRNVTLLCSSCWQGLTPFQEKMGHKPEPARVPIVNLQTRRCTMLNFEKHKDDEKGGVGEDGIQKKEPGGVR